MNHHELILGKQLGVLPQAEASQRNQATLGLNYTRTRSYKKKSTVNNAGLSHAENLVGYFPLKIFSVAKPSVSYAGFLFIGSGPEQTC